MFLIKYLYQFSSDCKTFNTEKSFSFFIYLICVIAKINADNPVVKFKIWDAAIGFLNDFFGTITSHPGSAFG